MVREGLISFAKSFVWVLTNIASYSLVVLAEKYRTAHLKNNPDYPQFIVGKDIAILRVDVVSARICNINDEVIKWNVMSGSSSNQSPGERRNTLSQF